MTDQTTQPLIDNGLLRLMIRDAVERETATVIAPLRTDIQIQSGQLKQFNRDVLVLQGLFSDLDELVRGNPKQNLIGLTDQVQRQSLSIAKLETELTAKIKGIETQLEQAADKREAMINQWRGAKYALVVLGFVTGLPYIETIIKVIGAFLN